MQENIIKLTIEDGETVNTYEGHTVIGGVTLLPLSSPIQITTPFSHGRVSAGDWCSMIVTAIKMTRQQCALKGIPAHIIEEVLEHAIKEGLEKER